MRINNLSPFGKLIFSVNQSFSNTNDFPLIVLWIVHNMNSLLMYIFASDIRLDWQIFNDDATSEKVVDLVTTYGKPFPLLDANGEDIVPEEEGQFHFQYTRFTQY